MNADEMYRKYILILLVSLRILKLRTQAKAVNYDKLVYDPSSQISVYDTL